MFSYISWLILIIALVRIAFDANYVAGQGPFMVNTPILVEQCSTTLLTWSGGVVPYIVIVSLDENGSGTPLSRWTDLRTTSVPWQVKLEPGVEVFVIVREGSGAISVTAPIPIEPGSDSCMGGPPPSPSASNPPPSPSQPPPSPSASREPTRPPPQPSSPPTPSQPSQPSQPPNSPSTPNQPSNNPSLSSGSETVSGQGPPTNSNLADKNNPGLGQHTGLSSGEVAAVAATSTVVPIICIVIFGAFCWKRKRRQQRKLSESDKGSTPHQIRDTSTAAPLIQSSAQPSRVQSYADTQTTTSGSSSGLTPFVIPAPTREHFPPSYVGGNVERNHGPGHFYRNYSDPAVVRLEPSPQDNRIGQPYRSKMQRELGQTGQPAELDSALAGSSRGQRNAGGPEVDPEVQAIVDDMRAEIERLKQQMNQGAAPPPQYHD